MRRSRFTEEQIIGILEEHAAPTSSVGLLGVGASRTTIVPVTGLTGPVPRDSPLSTAAKNVALLAVENVAPRGRAQGVRTRSAFKTFRCGVR